MKIEMQNDFFFDPYHPDEPELTKNKMHADFQRNEECDVCLEYKTILSFRHRHCDDHYTVHVCPECLEELAGVIRKVENMNIRGKL